MVVSFLTTRSTMQATRPQGEPSKSWSVDELFNEITRLKHNLRYLRSPDNRKSVQRKVATIDSILESKGWAPSCPKCGAPWNPATGSYDHLSDISGGQDPSGEPCPDYGMGGLKRTPSSGTKSKPKRGSTKPKRGASKTKSKPKRSASKGGKGASKGRSASKSRSVSKVRRNTTKRRSKAKRTKRR